MFPCVSHVQLKIAEQCVCVLFCSIRDYRALFPCWSCSARDYSFLVGHAKRLQSIVLLLVMFSWRLQSIVSRCHVRQRLQSTMFLCVSHVQLEIAEHQFPVKCVQLEIAE